jgi:AAA domain
MHVSNARNFRLALSIASKTAVLGKYDVLDPGPVLLFAAEDAPVMVRARLSGMAEKRQLSLTDLPIHLVMQRSLRLESSGDQARLESTVAQYRPKLLVLDPFVRLSSIDENSSMEVSAVLAFLRSLQTEHEVAILVVHHARKSGGNGSAAGLALRGSGDFWAWGDSNLYLRSKQGGLHLTVEHRSAAPPDPIALELCSDGPYLRLREGAKAEEPATEPLSERILEVLGVFRGPRKLEELRAGLRVRMQTLVNTLRELESHRQVQRVTGGWQLIDSNPNQPGETEAGNAEEHPAEG